MPPLQIEGVATRIGTGAFGESTYQYLQGLGARTFLTSWLVDRVLLCCKWARHLDKVDFAPWGRWVGRIYFQPTP